MNLYEILFKHYAPEDSEEGVFCYLVAEDDEDVYEWIKDENSVDDGSECGKHMFNNWGCLSLEDEDDVDYYGEEYIKNFKSHIIACKGDMFDGEVELDDLYYGKTLLGWRLVKENPEPRALTYLKDLGIRLEISKSDD